MTNPDITVHLCPPVGDGVTPCCGLSPFELSVTDRITLKESDVTCGRPAVDMTRGRGLGEDYGDDNMRPVSELERLRAENEALTGMLVAIRSDHAEVERLRAQIDALAEFIQSIPGEPSRGLSATEEAASIIAEWRAQRDAALALHSPIILGLPFCAACGLTVPWPCLTAQALGAEG